jgi:hypothetical protein
MNWVMQNTVKHVQDGFADWMKQGLYFTTTYGSPEFAHIEEGVTLSDFYSGTLEKRPLTARYGDLQTFYLNRVIDRRADANISFSHLSTYLDNLNSHISEYGADFEIICSRADEECEKEIEKEVEIEKEQELQRP